MSETIQTPDAASELVRTIAEREQRLAEAFAKQILSLERRALLAEQRLAVAMECLVLIESEGGKSYHGHSLNGSWCGEQARVTLAAIAQIKEGK